MEMLVASANKAYSALLGHSKRFGGLPVSISCYLFTVLVEPVMLYASEIWGMHSTETMERLVLSFCKHILCVPTTCSTTAVQGELGITPFRLTAASRAVKYFTRFDSPYCPPICKDAFLLSQDSSHEACYYPNMVISLKKDGFQTNTQVDIRKYETKIYNTDIYSKLASGFESNKCKIPPAWSRK